MSWIILAVIAALVVFAVVLYNGLVQRRNRIRNAWAQIDVQLQRRAELIPDLIESVRTYMRHETGIFDKIIEARRAAMSAGSDVAARAVAENTLTQSLKSLFSLAEAVPELRASENMKAFQEELSSTQNRIAYARQFFNDAVLDYNNAIASVPSNFIAQAMNFQPEVFFAADEEMRKHTPVKF